MSPGHRARGRASSCCRSARWCSSIGRTDKPRIVGYAAKWQEADRTNITTRRAPMAGTNASRGSEATLEKLSAATAGSCSAAAATPASISGSTPDRPYILEVNPNPCLSPDAGIAAAAEEAGVHYDDLIEHILPRRADDGFSAAWSGRRMPRPPTGSPAPAASSTKARSTSPASSSRTTSSRARTAPAIISSSPTGRAASDRARLFRSAIPATEGRAELYWIDVHPEARRKRPRPPQIADADGRGDAATAGTSAISSARPRRAPHYAPAREFLLCSRGFVQVADIPHWYAEDDGLCIFRKRKVYKVPSEEGLIAPRTTPRGRARAAVARATG